MLMTKCPESRYAVDPDIHPKLRIIFGLCKKKMYILKIYNFLIYFVYEDMFFLLILH